jgi:hypothetical protein
LWLKMMSASPAPSFAADLAQAPITEKQAAAAVARRAARFKESDIGIIPVRGGRKPAYPFHYSAEPHRSSAGGQLEQLQQF